MKKLFAAAFGLLSMTCAARAEDAWNHGGMYAGVAGGYSTGQLSAPGFTVGDQGLNGGAFIGYGIVGKSGLYLGIEADAMVKDVTWRVGDASSAVSASM